MELLAVVHIKSSYDEWKALFDEDPAVRSEFADESRTRVAKVDGKTAMVQLFDVDMQKMSAVLNDPNSEVNTSMEDHVERREMYKIEAMSPPGA